MSHTLSVINDKLTLENNKAQEIGKIGAIYPAHLYWHGDIEKEAVIQIKGEKVVRKRIPRTALPDGIHPSDNISQKWFNNLHKGYVKEWERINHPYPFHGE